MELKTQSGSDFIRQMQRAGEKYGYSGEPSSSPTPEPTEEKEINHSQLAAFIEQGEIYSAKTIRVEDKLNTEKWSEEKCIANCSRKVLTNFGARKLHSGFVEKIPRNCNKCVLCIEANTLQLKIKVQGYVEQAAKDAPKGIWRVKIVEPGKEAQSLKKRIKRNQGDRRFEAVSITQPGKVEVWTNTEPEASKNEIELEAAYGKQANPEEIDFDALYAENRATKKKLSSGSAFRDTSPKTAKKDTERVILADIVYKNPTQSDKGDEIIKNTNFLQIAKDADHANRLYIYQFKFILKELKAAGIEIAGIKVNFFNISKEDIVNDWNMNVQYWQMSTNNSLTKNSDTNVDTSRLIYPKVWPIETDETIIQ